MLQNKSVKETIKNIQEIMDNARIVNDISEWKNKKASWLEIKKSFQNNNTKDRLDHKARENKMQYLSKMEEVASAQGSIDSRIK